MKWGKDLPCQRRKNFFHELKFLLEKLRTSSHNGFRKMKRAGVEAESSALFFGKN